MSFEYSQENLQKVMQPALEASKNAQINNKKWDPQTELSDLSGKVAIVTGAYDPNGLGYQIAIQLALKGARVYITARSLEKAQGGATKMQEEAGSKSIDVRPLVTELASLESVMDAAKAIHEKETRLDILVNNAAVAGAGNEKLYGVIDNMVVNYLGPFLFTLELLPLIKKTQGSRIVNVSSLAAYVPPSGIQFKTVDDFNIPMGGPPLNAGYRYGLTKLANVLFTNELQRQFDAEGVSTISLSMHPGTVSTTGASKAGRPDLTRITPAEGALAPLLAAAHPCISERRQEYAGAYLVPYGEIFEKNDNMKNVELAKDLWKLSEEVVKEFRS